MLKNFEDLSHEEEKLLERHSLGVVSNRTLAVSLHWREASRIMASMALVPRGGLSKSFFLLEACSMQ